MMIATWSLLSTMLAVSQAGDRLGESELMCERTG
jgi:hypothetical protein